MSWTKSDIAKQAFEGIGISPYTYDIQPEMEMSAIRRLDAMMAEWDSNGIRLGYPLSSSYDGSSGSQDSNLPTWAVGPVADNLSLRIAATIGKQVTPMMTKIAHEGWLTLLSRTTKPRERRLDIMPAGAGNKTTQSQYFIIPPADDKLQSSGDGTLEIG